MSIHSFLRTHPKKEILEAVSEEGIADVKHLLRLDWTDLEVCEMWGGRTPLHIASAKGNLEIVKALVKSGVNINCKDHNGRTPLHCAARNGKASVVIFLNRRGASVNTRTKGLTTPLHEACARGHFETVEIILEASKPTEIDSIKQNGQTALHITCGSCENKESGVKIAGALLAKGANIHKRDNDGSTPLHMASASGQLVLIRLLMSKAPDALRALLTAKNRLGNTPHDFSIVNKKYECAIILLNTINELEVAEKAKEERVRKEEAKRLAIEQEKQEKEQLILKQKWEEKERQKQLVLAEKARAEEEERKRRELWGV